MEADEESVVLRTVEALHSPLAPAEPAHLTITVPAENEALEVEGETSALASAIHDADDGMDNRSTTSVLEAVIDTMPGTPEDLPVHRALSPLSVTRFHPDMHDTGPKTPAIVRVEANLLIDSEQGEEVGSPWRMTMPAQIASVRSQHARPQELYGSGDSVKEDDEVMSPLQSVENVQVFMLRLEQSHLPTHAMSVFHDDELVLHRWPRAEDHEWWCDRCFCMSEAHAAFVCKACDFRLCLRCWYVERHMDGNELAQLVQDMNRHRSLFHPHPLIRTRPLAESAPCEVCNQRISRSDAAMWMCHACDFVMCAACYESECHDVVDAFDRSRTSLQKQRLKRLLVLHRERAHESLKVLTFYLSSTLAVTFSIVLVHFVQQSVINVDVLSWIFTVLVVLMGFACLLRHCVRRGSAIAMSHVSLACAVAVFSWGIVMRLIAIILAVPAMATYCPTCRGADALGLIWAILAFLMYTFFGIAGTRLCANLCQDWLHVYIPQFDIADYINTRQEQVPSEDLKEFRHHKAQLSSVRRMHTKTMPSSRRVVVEDDEFPLGLPGFLFLSVGYITLFPMPCCRRFDEVTTAIGRQYVTVAVSVSGEVHIWWCYSWKVYLVLWTLLVGASLAAFLWVPWAICTRVSNGPYDDSGWCWLLVAMNVATTGTTQSV